MLEEQGCFKPRQVLLSHHTMKQSNNHTQAPSSADEALSLHPQHRTLLLHAVAFFLERNGFSKTLKKFRSEAQIQKGSSKDLLLSLEEMCHKHLKKCSQAITTENKPDEETVQEVADDRVPQAQEEPTKKSEDKKKIKKNAVPETHVEAAEKEKSNETTVHDEAGKKSKDKKKKKNKEKLETVATISDDIAVDSIGLNGDVASLEEKVVKSKTKKKKDGRHSSHENSNQLNGGTDILNEEERNDISKKRKRLASEDNDIPAVDEKATEEVKHRKLECSKGGNDSVQSTKFDVDAGKSSTINEVSPQTNKSVEKTAEKTSTMKAFKKHSNGSTEPKTINPFQRVKVDAVTFADEKLADNSYWAKGGAESGYGAKAQEVLGQVKGRGFRHEKTKKKRGSYRGGVIDLQSHSVKFNYSDDD